MPSRFFIIMGTTDVRYPAPVLVIILSYPKCAKATMVVVNVKKIEKKALYSSIEASPTEPIEGHKVCVQ